MSGAPFGLQKSWRGEAFFFFFLNWVSGKEIKNSALDILNVKCLKDIKRRCGVRS